MATIPLSRAQGLSPRAARLTSWLARRPLAAYFILAFVGTWVIMVPLALANVMVNDLLARGRYGVVPVMVILAVGYAFTLPWMLSHYHRLEVALQTLGVFNLLLFAACAIFIWGVKEKSPAKAAGQTIPAG